MDIDNLIAIDMHTHLEVSCRNPFDSYGEEYDRAADKYFRSSKRPTMDETLAYYRDQRIGFVNFTVDAETQLGRRRIPNEEISDAARDNPDIMIAFGSVDPHKGKFGAREVRRLIEEHGVKGFKFHPSMQAFEPNDRSYYPIYTAIAELTSFTLGYKPQLVVSNVGIDPTTVAGLLKSVSKGKASGTALIEGRMGIIEVEQGDLVPGLGRVDAIRKQDGRWVVVTSRGLITSGR